MAAKPEQPARWPVRRAVSAGGVVVRPGPGGPEVALTRRRTARGGDAWGLPKGALEEGESPAQAALREVREETGLEAEIVQPLDDLTYWYAWPPERVRYRKTVHFFLMRATGGDPSQHDEEVEEVRFVPVAEAVRLASYPSERALLRKVGELVAGW